MNITKIMNIHTINRVFLNNKLMLHKNKKAAEFSAAPPPVSDQLIQFDFPFLEHRYSDFSQCIQRLIDHIVEFSNFFTDFCSPYFLELP